MPFTTEHIDHLERNHLDNVDLSIKMAPGEIILPVDQSTCIARIHGISKLWTQEDGNINLIRSLMSDVTTGLNGQASPILYLISGDPTAVRVYMGTCAFSNANQVEQELVLRASGSLDTLLTSLQGTFPDLQYAKVANAEEFTQLKNHLGMMKYAGLVVGTPTTKVDGQKEGGRQIERLIHGLYGSAWSFMVVAVPIQAREVISLFNRTLNEIRKVQNEQQAAKTANPIDKHYEKLLRIMLAKLDVGKRQGMWHTAAYLLTQDKDVFGRGQSLITASFGGIKSRPDRIRVLPCHDSIDNLRSFSVVTTRGTQSPGEFRYPFEYLSLQNSEELATFTQIPVDERPGYFVSHSASFDVAPHVKNVTKPVRIGEILDHSRKIGCFYDVDIDSLTRHGLITGTTGSGKTNTIFYLLKQIWSEGVPFLVIEPAKSEYRSLLGSKEFGADLRVFTLGNESISPFRLNPFEIMPGVSVQTHIDRLKALFNASFVMYAPMPYVLERCIHEIYEDKGWDLVSNLNKRGNHKLANPTLSDLYRKIDDVVNRLGYERELTMDITAALKTRIQSLRIGGKGLMLDTRDSIPMAMLLEKPVVLELEQIGNDEEKAFAIGLILMFLYEYHVSHGVKENAGLEHLTVIEEAHRLLRQIPVSENPEVANMRGQAVEAFCNMLSEVRAYGEGFLVAEQIPSKLASDIVKNTSLKVVHRIGSMEDREIVGSTMNLDDEQQRRIVSLEKGDAAIFGQGDDAPLLAHVPYAKIDLEQSEQKEQIRKSAEGVWQAIDGTQAQNCWSQAELAIRAAAGSHLMILDDVEFSQEVSRYVLSMVTREDTLVEGFPRLAQAVRRKLGGSGADFDLIQALLTSGIRYFFEERGEAYAWPFDQVEELLKSFEMLFEIVFTRYKNGTNGKLKADERKNVHEFQKLYKTTCRIESYPFSGCEIVCDHKECLYGYDVALISRDVTLKREFYLATDKRVSPEEFWESIVEVCLQPARRIVNDAVDFEGKKRIALCYAVQTIVTSDLNLADRKKMVGQLVNALNPINQKDL